MKATITVPEELYYTLEAVLGASGFRYGTDFKADAPNWPEWKVTTENVQCLHRMSEWLLERSKP